MKKWIVNVTRAGFSNSDFVVEANTLAQARRKAVVKAYAHNFREHDADYRVESATALKKEDVDA